MMIINDVEKFLGNNENYCAMQQTIRVDIIFRGFIVKDWFSIDTNTRGIINIIEKQQSCMFIIIGRVGKREIK